jgi:hypothetical protein
VSSIDRQQTLVRYKSFRIVIYARCRFLSILTFSRAKVARELVQEVLEQRRMLFNLLRVAAHGSLYCLLCQPLRPWIKIEKPTDARSITSFIANIHVKYSFGHLIPEPKYPPQKHHQSPSSAITTWHRCEPTTAKQSLSCQSP